MGTWRGTGWLLAGLWAGSGQLPVGEPAGGPALEVRLHTAAPREVPWLDDAAARVRAIFRVAGIRASWVRCLDEPAPSRCARPPRGNEFIVRIEDQSPDAPSKCGLSVSQHHVTVYENCVGTVATELEAPAGLVAAYVMAHEIGHALLPFGHNSEGIMRARLDGSSWALAARGALGFTPDEARQMQEALRRRLAADEREETVTASSSR